MFSVGLLGAPLRHGVCLLAAVVVAIGLSIMPGGLRAQEPGCAAFDSQIWAQSVYSTDSAQHAELDPDGNGIACEALPLGAAPALWTDELPAGAEPTTLASVTDGDTIRVWIDGRNEPVRLILIDTPETRRPGSPIECFGPEATAYLQWLLSLGGELYLERDVSERDRYDRLLRYVWLELDGEVYLVNEVMARSGYASLSTYPPDVKYVDQIREAATFAREHGYGLWSACGTDAALPTSESRFVPRQELDAQAALSGAPFISLDPATGQVIATYPDGSVVPVEPSPGPTMTHEGASNANADTAVISGPTVQDRPCADWDDACWDAYEAMEAERAEEYDRERDYEAALDAFYDGLDECMDVGCELDYRSGP